MSLHEKGEPFICDPCRNGDHWLCPLSYRWNGVRFHFKPCADMCAEARIASFKTEAR